MRPSRRALLTGAGATIWASATGAGEVASIRVRNGAPPFPVSPLIYGSGEIGTLDGGPPSAELDRAAGVSLRRFGGNFATSYNWTNNACNAGKDWQQANGDFLSESVGLPQVERNRPAAVIAAMHGSSLSMGASSIVTLPLAGFVAADKNGPVGPDQAAPSARFVPVSWEGRRPASAPVDPRVADIPHCLATLIDRFGPAGSETGIRGYILDNEPGLWATQHPRIVRAPVRIADLIARALKAARVIKAIDPGAWVIGPASWGVTGMVSLQNAPDWDAFKHHGSFLAAYLDAFRQASERDGRRLLDVLDVHWYPFSDRGTLFRSEDPALAASLLDAPRSLTEPGFREASWVTQALPVAMEGGLSLPLLPSLERIVRGNFPARASPSPSTITEGRANSPRASPWPTRWPASREPTCGSPPIGAPSQAGSAPPSGSTETTTARAAAFPIRAFPSMSHAPTSSRSGRAWKASAFISSSSTAGRRTRRPTSSSTGRSRPPSSCATASMPRIAIWPRRTRRRSSQARCA